MLCGSSSLPARTQTQGRSIKAMRQAPTLRSLRWDTCPFDSDRPCQTFPPVGVYANGQSGLSFKQSPTEALRVRAPPPLSDPFALAVAQLAERCTVNAVRCGFESRRPTSHHSTRGVSQARTKARDSLSRKRGFESRTPCQTFKSEIGGILMKAASARAHERGNTMSTDAAAGSLERFVHVPETAYEIPRPTAPVPQP